MQKLIYLTLILLIFGCSQTDNSLPDVNIIPKPNLIEQQKGRFKLNREISVNINSECLVNEVELLKSQIKNIVSIKIENTAEADIQIHLDEKVPEKSYSLAIFKKSILLKAGSQNAAFYGLQTLRQLLVFAENEKDSKYLPILKIEDSPRFGWRGLMLDESRHFFGIEKVKQLLDVMAFHKLNIFHWHLTDVPGWRLEIKKYPKLTTIGGIGNDINPEASAKFYTQEEIKEIVKYAADRYIEIIPEIDMPGHAKAANRAYPEFSGGGSESHPEFTFNPGYEGTYAYLTNILREVTTMFPSKYIHLGGDEVHFGNKSWNTNKHVQTLMKKENLKNLKEVEAYFVRRMADSIQMLNKIVVGWDEVVDLNLDKKNTLVMWWRHDKTGELEQAVNEQYQTVLCPRIPLYFDFVQDESHEWGRKWGGAFSTLELTYNFPPDTLPGLKGNEKLIPGIQANIWTERIQNNKRLDFMTHPRLSALAEAAWTNHKNKNFTDFERRLQPMLSFLKNEGIFYYNPFTPEETPEPVGVDKKKQK